MRKRLNVSKDLGAKLFHLSQALKSLPRSLEWNVLKTDGMAITREKGVHLDVEDYDRLVKQGFVSEVIAVDQPAGFAPRWRATVTELGKAALSVWGSRFPDELALVMR